tara:strand:+ start:498 stop:941 length:444 start_codon:yes stop_codon:yes gene_type:complete
MISKTGKQLMVKNYENYKVLSGTVDNRKPKTLYLNISAWGLPLIDDDDINYNGVIRYLTKSIKTELFNTLDRSLFIPNRTIVDFDMRTSGIQYGKKSYMNCEITLFQKHSFKLQEKIIQSSIKSISENITDTVLDKNIYFSFHKTKN